MSDLLGERYSLVRRIGKGGYGDVWLGRDENSQADVAIKILDIKDSSRQGSKQKTERFRRETLSMAKIRHPNVVAIYDVGAVPQKQELFIVMELLQGRNLFEEIAEHGPMSPDRCLSRFIEALHGLEAAHRVGVIHKDLKPANLLLHRVGEPEEQLKLIDFGIARMESLSKLTGTGRMAGSPRYLAPEYIMGEDVSPSVDVYQMALILVEALTAQPCIPRDLEFFKVCQRHILSELDVPPTLAASPLGAILDKAMQRHPADRYSTAQEFADALSEIDPASLPRFATYHDDETIISPIPDFDRTMPDSERTVTQMIEKLREHESSTNRYVSAFAAGDLAAAPVSEAPKVEAPRPAKPGGAERTPLGARPMVWVVWIAAAALVASVAAAAAIHWSRRSASATEVPQAHRSDAPTKSATAAE